MARASEELLSRLYHARQRARLALRRFRENREDAVRQYVGAHWGEEGSDKKRPVNLLALYVKVISRSLIAKEPRYLLSTFQKQSGPAVAAMQTWMNEQVQDMNLAMTLQRVVVDALFSVGITKVALASPADASVSGWNLPAGQPYAERVDLDDLVFDVHARDFLEVEFIGHRYRCRKRVADKLFKEKLPVSEDSAYNVEGDQRVTAMQRLPYAQSEQEFEDHVDLWEIYVPHERLVLTLADDSHGGFLNYALKEQEWIGPDCGPYHVLAFGPVPGNAMPKGQIPDLLDLDSAINELYRKLIRQGQRQKENLLYRDGAAEDAQRHTDASDGQTIRCDDPQTLVQMKWGGPAQENMALVMEMVQRFSWMAGNLDILGGLSPQSKTATQDAMLNQNSSATVADLQSSVIKHTADVGRALCWYWWNHPTQVMKTTYKLPGMPEFQLPQEVHPRGGTGPLRRDAPWSELKFRVDPYSLQYQSPQARLQAITQVLTMIQPFMPIMAQQGIMLDMGKLISIFASYLDMPDLTEIMTVMEPPSQSSTPKQAGGTSPAETTRNYVRENMPGRTQRGNEMNLINTLMGANGSQNGSGDAAGGAQAGGIA